MRNRPGLLAHRVFWTGGRVRERKQRKPCSWGRRTVGRAGGWWGAGEHWGGTLDHSSFVTLKGVTGRGPDASMGRSFWSRGGVNLQQHSITLCGRHWVDSHNCKVGLTAARRVDSMLEAQRELTTPESRHRVKKRQRQRGP